MRFLAFPLVLSLLAFGCSGPKSTAELEVRVVTGLVPGPEFNRVETQILHADGFIETVVARAEASAHFGLSYSRGMTVATFPAIPKGETVIRVRAYAPQGSRLVEQVLSTRVDANRSVTLYLDRACIAVECPSPGGSAALAACLAGECVDSRCDPSDPATREFCPAVRFCNLAADCPAVAACAERSCVDGVCIETPRTASEGGCEDGLWCNPAATENECQEVPESTLPEPAADAGVTCGTICFIDGNVCETGYWACGDAGAPECVGFVFAPAGTTCGAGNVCDSQGACVVAVDAGVNGDGGMDAMIDASTAPDMAFVDLGRDSSSDAGLDASPDAALDAGPTPCPSGYGGTVETGCEDLDECAMHTDACTTNQHCSNTEGSFMCHDLLSVTVAEGSHTCALFAGGHVKCWGSNAWGQLGYGDTTNRTSPPTAAVDLGEGRSAKALAADGGHTCAILDDDSVKCWGWNFYGELGYGDGLQRTAPSANSIDLGEGRTALAIATSSFNTCAILDDGSLKCWGNNSSGELGYGDTTFRNAPPSTAIDLGEDRTAVAVSVGGTHTCAILDDGSLKCWGNNGSGELGYGDTTNRNAPPTEAIAFGVGRSVRVLSARASNTCARLDNNTMRCWGSNTSGQLGYGDLLARDEPSESPVDFGVPQYVTHIRAGASVCVQLDNATLTCWGANLWGQLGYDDTTMRTAPETSPIDFGLGRTVLAFDSGGSACAMLDDLGLRCWGANHEGQLGYGDTMNRLAPPTTRVNLRGH